MSAILFCLFGSTQTLASQLDRSIPLVSTPQLFTPWFFGFVVRYGFPFFRLLACDFRFWFFQFRRNCQIQTCTGSQCGFTSFVGYDRRSFRNCFQQRLIFFLTPVYAINIFLRSCTSGSYVVTKDNSVSLLLSFCFSADCQS